MGPRGPTLYIEPRLAGLRSAVGYWKIRKIKTPLVTSLAPKPNVRREIDY